MILGKREGGWIGEWEGAREVREEEEEERKISEALSYNYFSRDLINWLFNNAWNILRRL